MTKLLDPPTIQIQVPDRAAQYRSTGVIKGEYLPSADNPAKGILATADSVFPARLAHYWTKAPSGEQLWNCWVKTNKQTGLAITLKGVYRDQYQNPVPIEAWQEDLCSVRGKLSWWDSDRGLVGIAISPNPINRGKFKPFTVAISGHIPNPKKGSFWEIDAIREGDKLVIIDGRELFPPQQRKKKSLPTRNNVRTKAQ